MIAPERDRHLSPLGKILAATNTNGHPHAVYTMEAFGNVLEKGTSTGYSSEHGTDPQPYHLTTKEYDADVGLYYFNARWYDSNIGRFVSREPNVASPNGVAVTLDDPRRLHPYIFCGDNPVGLVDATGEQFHPNVACEIRESLEEDPPIPRFLWSDCWKACEAMQAEKEAKHPDWYCECYAANLFSPYNPPGPGTHALLECCDSEGNSHNFNPSIGPHPLTWFPWWGFWR